MNPAITCWRRNLRPSMRRFRSKFHARRSAIVRPRRRSRARCSFGRGIGGRRSLIRGRYRGGAVGEVLFQPVGCHSAHGHCPFFPPPHEGEGGPGGEVPQHFAPTRAFFPTAFLPFRRTVPPCSRASAPPPCSASTPISWTSRPTSRTASPPSPPWGCRREP